MNIVVCVKQVPDSAAKVVVEDGQVNWGEAPLVINPWDEYAVEAALQVAKETGADVTAITLGKEEETEALKHALAMGCSEAVLVSDPAFEDADAAAAARALAAAIQKVEDVGLVFLGKQAIDSDTGTTASAVARLLGWPAMTLAASIDNVDADSIQVTRAMEEGRQVIKGSLPAVLSIVKDFGEPRYPSFMGIRKASRAKIPTWTLADLGIDAPDSAVDRIALMNPPEREVTTEIIEGDSPEDKAKKLADKIMAEKVL